MAKGVFNCQVTLDLSEAEKLYAYLLKHIKARGEKTKIRRELKEAKKETYCSFRELLEKFYYAVYVMVEMEKCPQVIKNSMSGK